MTEADAAVSKLRAALGLTGFPRPRHTWQAACYLENAGRIMVETVPEGRPYTALRRDGVRVIVLVESEGEEAMEAALLEELGHVLLGLGKADSLPRTPAARRLALLRDDREEREVRRFCLAWRVPEFVFEDLRCWPDLPRETGCTREELAERFEHVGMIWPDALEGWEALCEMEPTL